MILDMVTGEFCSVVVLFLALVPWIGYIFIGSFFLLSIIYSRCYLYRDTPIATHSKAPGVSIVKPLMGQDTYLEENLESHFTLDYPKFELLFCVHTSDDAALPIVHKLQQKYPSVPTRLFIGGKNGILNPMVNNMAPAYEAAQYGHVWICTSRVKVHSAVLCDMVGKMQSPGVALVHQMPFVSDQPGLSAAVEKIYFGCTQARYYLAFHVLGVNCFTGMSYLVNKAELDKVRGLSYYGRYLAEDFFFSKKLHAKGFSHRVAAYPAIQHVATQSLSSHTHRMIRWSRLRINMIPLVSGVLEPLAESIPLGMYMAWSMWHFYSLNPVLWFITHICVWCLLDYVLLTSIQGQLSLSLLGYLRSWLLRELLSIAIYIRAFLNVRHIRWGRKVFRLSRCGRELEHVSSDNSIV